MSFGADAPCQYTGSTLGAPSWPSFRRAVVTSGEDEASAAALPAASDAISADDTMISGIYYIDALLAGATARWNASQPFGTATTVTYSFMSGPPADANSNERLTFAPFTTAQQAAARAALAQISAIANITFTEVAASNAANIRYGMDRQSSSAGYTYVPGSAQGGEVYLASNDPDNADMTPGDYGFMTLLHETGHAIGLKHPGNYNAVGGSAGGGGTPPYLPTSEDTYQYSVMSYNASPAGVYDKTYMLDDIAAIQFLYGANTAARNGNDTYTFDTAGVGTTIWDGGGIDTFDLSNQTVGRMVNLAAGAYSSIGDDGTGKAATNDAAIAYGTTIENVVAGAGDDTILGNSADNALSGRAGNDSIFGSVGDDVVNGNLGNDMIHGGRGNDTIHGGQGDDALFGDLGDDQLWGDLGNDTLTGGPGADTFCFAAHSGHDVITDFNAAQGDRIGVSGGLPHIVSSNAAGQAVITFSATDDVALIGVTASQVQNGWFVTI